MSFAIGNNLFILQIEEYDVSQNCGQARVKLAAQALNISFVIVKILHYDKKSLSVTTGCINTTHREHQDESNSNTTHLQALNKTRDVS